MNILIFTHASPQFLPSVIVDADETICGPQYTNLRTDGRWKYINTPRGVFDYQAFSERIALQKPDLILIHADSTLGCLPLNLPPSIPKALLIGAIHHLQSPIQNLLNYAAQVKCDAIIHWNRQFAHFFTEFGFDNVFWIPGLIFAIPEFPTSSERESQLCFFGQMGPYHPRRNRMIRELQRLQIPIVGGKLTRRDSLELVAKSTLSLNITLNSEFNLRVFESTQYGALLLTDKLAPQTGMEIFYPDGEAVVTYSNIQDLCEKILLYSTEEKLARSIAENGRSITREYFSFEARRKALFALLNNEVTYDVFRLAGEPRCMLPACSPENRESLILRVQLYEHLQELHRLKEKVRVVHTDGIDPLIIADLADRVRLEQQLVIKAGDYEENWKQAFEELGVQNLSTMEPEELASSESDIFVTTIADLDKAGVPETIQSLKHLRVFISDLYFNQDKRIDRAMIEFGYQSQHKMLYGLFALPKQS